MPPPHAGSANGPTRAAGRGPAGRISQAQRAHAEPVSRARVLKACRAAMPVGPAAHRPVVPWAGAAGTSGGRQGAAGWAALARAGPAYCASPSWPSVGIVLAIPHVGNVAKRDECWPVSICWPVPEQARAQAHPRSPGPSADGHSGSAIRVGRGCHGTGRIRQARLLRVPHAARRRGAA